MMKLVRFNFSRGQVRPSIQIAMETSYLNLAQIGNSSITSKK